jgi:antirestriction protein ArdC
MPDRGRFTAASDWNATLFHELAHSSGHRDRLDRRELYSGRFGSPDYAREELTAELAAAMLCLAAGIDSPRLTEQHAAYIDHWRQTIGADPRLVTTAAQRAQRPGRRTRRRDQRGLIADAPGALRRGHG